MTTSHSSYSLRQLSADGRKTVEAIKSAVPADHRLRNQMSFLLGEGSQLAFNDETAASIELAFVVTLGATPNGPSDGLRRPDQRLPPKRPASSSWRGITTQAASTSTARWGNRRPGSSPATSRHALVDPTQGKSIESHKSGALLMKELKVPWVNWHSSFARIFARYSTGRSPSRTSRFTNKEPGGAHTFEVARQRLRAAKARLEALTASAAPIARPARIIEQIVTTPTINLISSPQESQAAAASSDPAELPNLLRRR